MSASRPEQFSATGQGKHREGFVVELTTADGSSWVANFQRGLTSYSSAHVAPDGRTIFVVAGGTAYVVDVETRSAVHTFGAQIEYVLFDEPRSQLVFGNGLWFESWTRDGLRWRSARVAWDGVRELAVVDAKLAGKTTSYDGHGYDFAIDLETGETTGGVPAARDFRP